MSGNLRLLAATLASAKQENRAALITYMTAGFPTVSEAIAAIQAMLNSGADIVEVGLPHSDPVLDGPVIQAADDIALRGGVRIAVGAFGGFRNDAVNQAELEQVGRGEL